MNSGQFKKSNAVERTSLADLESSRVSALKDSKDCSGTTLEKEAEDAPATPKNLKEKIKMLQEAKNADTIKRNKRDNNQHLTSIDMGDKKILIDSALVLELNEKSQLQCQDNH